jgi:putative transposase
VRIAKYGWVRVAAPCTQQAKLRRLLRRGQATVQHITVTRHSDGCWYATVNYTRAARVPAEQRTAPAGPVVGVDRGVATAAVARLGRAHARAAAVRADALHRFTARLARDHGAVVVEDLATANLMANRHLAAAISDQGWTELARQLGYQTARHGGHFLVADRWFASSQTCSACGAVRPKLTLAERTYRCGNDSCGHVADRDVNAAANLAAWGEHTLGLCPCAQGPCVTRAGDRHPGGPTAEEPRHACGGWVSAAIGPAAAVPPGEAGTSRPRIGVA